MYDSVNAAKSASPNDKILDDPNLQDPDAGVGAESKPIEMSPELERMLVGHILLDETCLRVAEQQLEPKAFSNKAHSTAVGAAYEYFRQYGKPCPIELLREQCKEQWKGNKAAPAYLAELCSIDYVPVNTPEYWQDQIVSLGLRRKISTAFLDYAKGGDSTKFFSTVDSVRQTAGPAEWKLYTPDELADLDGLEWQIADHFPKKGTVCVFGSSGAGKSFLCLDMALSVASGTPFLGKHEVKAGRVLYVNSEGSYNLKNRIAAWKAGHPSVAKMENVVFSTVSHNLQDRAEVERLIQRATAKLGGVDLVIIDTLSRNFGPGDTDLNKDMQAYLRSVDLIREQTGAAVVNVHHTGWNETDRERGAKSLRDYCDTSICVAKDGDEQIEVSCKKQKDGPDFEAYRLQKVQAAGSLRLQLVGVKRDIKKAEQVQDAEQRLQDLLEHIPDLPLDEAETDGNTITAADVVTRTGWGRTKVQDLLKQLEERGLVSRRRFGDSKSPLHYWRRSEIAS